MSYKYICTSPPPPHRLREVDFFFNTSLYFNPGRCIWEFSKSSTGFYSSNRSDHSIVPPPPPPHQLRLNPGSVIVLDHFLNIEVLLNMLQKAAILYLLNALFYSQYPITFTFKGFIIKSQNQKMVVRHKIIY